MRPHLLSSLVALAAFVSLVPAPIFAQGGAPSSQVTAKPAPATKAWTMPRTPDGTPDLTIAREILAFGMFPTPLSAWYASAETSRSGLLLGVPTSPTKELARSCDRLVDIIRRFS